MNIEAPFGIWITTYEINNSAFIPTLTHIFWGQTLSQAFDVANPTLLAIISFHLLLKEK